MDEASIVDLSGVSINSAGKVTAYFSLSPGHSHSHHGSPTVINRILLSSQSQANQLAGLYRGWMNNPYPSIPLKLSANNRLIDICPRQKSALAILSGDTIRGISGTLGLIPLSVEMVFDPETGYLRTEVNFEAETFEDLSTIGDYIGSGDVSTPPLPPLPPLPPIDIIIPGTGTDSEPEGDPSRVLLHDNNAGLLYTENFEDSSPSWHAVNAGLTEDQYQSINKIVITPSGGVYVAHRRRTGFGTEPFIAYASSIGATFTIIEDQTSIQAKLPTSDSSSWSVNALGVNPLTGQTAYIIGVNEERAFFIGSGTSFAQAVDLTGIINLGEIGTITFGFNNWRVTGAGSIGVRFLAISADGSTVIRNVNMTGDGYKTHIPISTSDAVIGGVLDSLIRITQNGAVLGDFSNLLGSDVIGIENWDNKAATDPTGTLILLPWDTGQRGKSSDGGASISGIPSLPFGGIYAYSYAGGVGAESRWIAGAGILRFSDDFGTTWQNKEGNLSSVAPIPSISIVKAIGYNNAG